MNSAQLLYSAEKHKHNRTVTHFKQLREVCVSDTVCAVLSLFCDCDKNDFGRLSDTGGSATCPH